MRTTDLLAAIVTILLAVGCKKEPKQRDVKYTVTCQSCTARYFNESGHEAVVDVGSYFEVSLKVEEGSLAYVSAQKSTGTTEARATILKDGSTWRTSSTTAAYGVAQAMGVMD